MLISRQRNNYRLFRVNNSYLSYHYHFYLGDSFFSWIYYTGIDGLNSYSPDKRKHPLESCCFPVNVNLSFSLFSLTCVTHHHTAIRGLHLLLLAAGEPLTDIHLYMYHNDSIVLTFWYSAFFMVANIQQYNLLVTCDIINIF